MAKKQGGAGAKKYGRTGKKAARRGSPISLFVRNKISGQEYFKQINQPIKG